MLQRMFMCGVPPPAASATSRSPRCGSSPRWTLCRSLQPPSCRPPPRSRSSWAQVGGSGSLASHLELGTLLAAVQEQGGCWSFGNPMQLCRNRVVSTHVSLFNVESGALAFRCSCAGTGCFHPCVPLQCRIWNFGPPMQILRCPSPCLRMLEESHPHSPLITIWMSPGCIAHPEGHAAKSDLRWQGLYPLAAEPVLSDVWLNRTSKTSAAVSESRHRLRSGARQSGHRSGRLVRQARQSCSRRLQAIHTRDFQASQEPQAAGALLCHSPAWAWPAVNLVYSTAGHRSPGAPLTWLLLPLPPFFEALT